MSSTTKEALSELEVLFPGRVITVAGEAILIMPFRLTQIPVIASMMAKYYRLSGTSETLDVVDLIEKAGEDVWTMMCMAIGKDRAWLDTLSGEEGVELLSTIIEENSDFFIRKLSPAIVALSERVTAGVGGLSARH